MQVSDDEFQIMINDAMASLPKEHIDNVRNVAILYEDEPTPQQRVKLELRHDQSLLGLYEGVPLTSRNGVQPIFPDRITLFKLPLISSVHTREELPEAIRHTLWHEIAHYYGLNHDQIRDLE